MVLNDDNGGWGAAFYALAEASHNESECSGTEDKAAEISDGSKGLRHDYSDHAVRRRLRKSIAGF